MSHLPDFEYDIFISYSHKDNESPFTWVDDFDRALRTYLRQVLGRDAKIWRDKRDLMSNDYFEDVIKDRLSKSAFLVPILSPNYINSDWCRRELQEFCRVAERTGGLRVDKKSRIFKIIKTHLPVEQHPPELKGLLSHEFFGEASDTGHLRDFSFDSGVTHPKFMDKIQEVAYSVRKMIDFLQARKEGAQSQTSTARPEAQTTVYLAETTSDQRSEREKIWDELDQRGYAILPDPEKELSHTSDFQGVVRESLERSRLSIHLVGEKYGIVPEDENRSVVELQIDLATELREGPPFRGLIWIPEGLIVKDERQQKFIERLQNVSDPPRVEVVQTSLEGLKTFIGDKLKAIEEELRAKKERQETKKDGRAHVYLVCDQQDLDETEPVADYLCDPCGYDTFLPETEGDERELSEDHNWKLQQCDAILIYYHNAPHFWLNRRMRELVTVKLNQSKRFLAEAVYMIGAKANEKPSIRSRDTKFIKSFEGFSPESLKPFLTQLESVKGGLR